MSSLTEIQGLLGELASHLRASNASSAPSEAPASSAHIISSLSRTLNCSGVPRVRVLETALSLLCFTTTDVSVPMVEYLAETCMVAMCSLTTGASMSAADCLRLLQTSADLIGSLRLLGKDSLSSRFLRAVLMAVTLKCRVDELPSSFCEVRDSVFEKIRFLLQEEPFLQIPQTPSKILLWYLYPLALKHELSEMLKEAADRPFLCLEKELHDRIAWRSTVICLAASPPMFVEARALLHNWFLLVGLAFVNDFSVKLVMAVLDALSRPLWWGMPVEWGLRLQFPHAYFPSTLRDLLGKVTGPVSYNSFLDVVHLAMNYSVIESSDVAGMNGSHGSLRQWTAESVATSHLSSWALLMEFPYWFYYATMLLLYGEDSELIPVISDPLCTVEKGKVGELKNVAARFIAWILSPADEICYASIVKSVTELSMSWPPKQAEEEIHLDQKCRRDKRGRGLKLKRPADGGDYLNELQSAGMIHWLQKVQYLYESYYHTTRERHAVNLRDDVSGNLLFRKIPLGVVLGCSSFLDDMGCEQLLHYSATGKMLGSREMQNVGTMYSTTKIQHGDDAFVVAQNFTSGAVLVFNLVDLVKRISVSMFDNEESEHYFICRIKGKVSKYLIKCLSNLLENGANEGRSFLLEDISKRLKGWVQEGERTFEGCESIREVYDWWNMKMCSL